MSAKPPALPGSKVSELRQVFLAQRPLLLRALLFSVFVNALVLAPTLFMLQVYDRVMNSRNATTLAMLLLLVLGAYVAMELLDLVRERLLHALGDAVDEALRERLFDAVFEASLLRRPGGSTQAFQDLRTLREFVASPAVVALLDVPGSVLFLVVVAFINPWLAVGAAGGGVILLLLGLFGQRRAMARLGEASKVALEAQQYAQNGLRNAQVSEALGMEAALHQRWLARQRKALLLQAQASKEASGSTALAKLVQSTQSSLILAASCWLTLQGLLPGNGGWMMVASTLAGRVLAPLTQITAQWRAVSSAREAWLRLDVLLRSIPASVPGMPLPRPRGRLRVDAVMAHAPGSSRPLLRGLSLGLEPGEALAVVGPSGSGKTTLARLLVGTWAPSAGTVRLDGAEVHGWNRDELGQYLGYLPQSVELLNGTIAENIARFGDFDTADVRRAARLVDLEAFIDSLPQGFDTPVGVDGAFLSGGMRQRVGLARALYGQPALVVLDEPNSSLDTIGEQALMATLARLKAAGTTVVVITHRSGLLAAADKLLLLQDGQARAFGPRDQVLAELRRQVEQAGPAAADAPRRATAGAAA